MRGVMLLAWGGELVPAQGLAEKQQASLPPREVWGNVVHPWDFTFH